MTVQGCRIDNDGWGKGKEAERYRGVWYGTTDENRIRGKRILPNITIQG